MADDELLYEIDEDDNIIGKMKRSKMRKNNLWHRGVSVVVQNSKGEILIHKRTQTKDLFPGYYDSFVGGCVGIETYDEAAVRETEEEIESARFVPVEELKQLLKTEKFCPDGIEMIHEYLDKYY